MDRSKLEATVRFEACPSCGKIKRVDKVEICKDCGIRLMPVNMLLLSAAKDFKENSENSCSRKHGIAINLIRYCSITEAIIKARGEYDEAMREGLSSNSAVKCLFEELREILDENK